MEMPQRIASWRFPVIEHLDHLNRPLIVMSDHADPVLQAEATRNRGAFLEEPIDVDHLLRLIAWMLAARPAGRRHSNPMRSFSPRGGCPEPKPSDAQH
jgi:FixJ family two-component response regulator